MLNLMIRGRFVAVVVVIALLAGTLILIGIGSYYTWEAILLAFGGGHPPTGASATLAAKLALLEAVDSFLFALIMLYFAFGTYFLVVNPQDVEQKSSLPDWLHVKGVGQMKKTLLEVIVVLIAVVFLHEGLSAEYDPGWSILVFPISIVALAITLKLVPFDH